MSIHQGRSVLLVDDHTVVREGLRLLLETVMDMNVIEASSGPEALSVIGTTDDVDVVLLDARMPEQDGIWTLGKIREERPELPVLMLSTYDTDDYVQDSMSGGAAGYVLKEASSQQLTEAIDTALSGRGVYLHPEVAMRVLSRTSNSVKDHPSLSARELEVLEFLAAGATNEEIANALFLSEKTVKSHLSSIFRKLGVTNRTQAASRAIRDKMVKLPT